jgi:glycerol-3-phosphate dehydrogenase
VSDESYDLLVIGGGVNGAGIARDAAGRGYRVLLAEAGDFGGATSSASTKLLHGGLRYLEYFEFRLVREALVEREVLLRNMPHISRPMRFVLPYDRAMRFEGATPTSKLLSLAMPWMRGRRPPWLIRFGLYLYDHLGGRGVLPGTRTLDLTRDEAGKPLQKRFVKAFEYSDGWVEDSRLVILNLQDAQARGAEVHRSTHVVSARHEGGLWHALLDRDGVRREVTARMVVNAAGPWVDRVLASVFGLNNARNVRLVRGSHIVVKAKFAHDRAYFFQNADTRIIFAIPYEGAYTLIGTTDVDHPDASAPPKISADEVAYLCRMASAYFAEAVTEADVVWTYSGVRPLYNDGAGAAQAATRDYVLKREAAVGGGTLVNVFGGKITTFRRLAESALELIEETLGKRGPAWTKDAALPGGDFAFGGAEALAQSLRDTHPWLDQALARRLVRQYGTVAREILEGCRTAADLGEAFGAGGLSALEVRHLMTREWAGSAEDIAFRRTRLGIGMTPAELARLDAFIAGETAVRTPDVEVGRA